MRRISLSIIILFGFWNSLSASSFPFTDVIPSDSYYEGVKALYDYGIITNDGDNLFRPNDPITRDVFVGLATSVSCKKCLTPTIEDIIKYQVSPFVDLSKSNPNYYCIAYAHEINIVQGYTIGSDNNVSCQNGTTYSTSPFCSQNNTSRIEAVGMLLRQAGLWNDAKNSNYTPNIDITDASTYWRGYAEKGIQAKILTLKDNNKVYPDEIITRGEFANMASKILAYNQCITERDRSIIASDIITQDISGKRIEKIIFDKGTTDGLSVVGSSGDWIKRWTLINPVTGQILNGTGEIYPLKDLDLSKWIAKVELLDPQSKEVLSTSIATIFIISKDAGSRPGLSVNINATPLMAAIGEKIDFAAIVSGGAGDNLYSWDFGDGTRDTKIGDNNHIYTAPGPYRVTLTVTDKDGNTSQSTIIVVIGGDIDTDKDGIKDSDDICPYVFGIVELRGCPELNTTDYTKSVGDLLSGKISEETGSIISKIRENACIQKYQSNTGIIVGSPICDTCPCQSSLSILTPLRSCDIIFPSILSPDKKNIYIRGGFYQIP